MLQPQVLAMLGLVFTVLALGFFVTSMTAKQLTERLGLQIIAIGALLLAIGHGLMMAVVLRQPGSGGIPWLLPVLFLQGAGLGMIIAPLMSAVLAGVALIDILFYADWAAPRLGFVAAAACLLALALAVALLFQRLVRAPRPAGASCTA
ncbi:hypothetical protein A8M77_20550 [Variovorax sp. JS1663]|nr:hypothetical protein A8M77_20550 [Variovorax sp. JS1663]